MCLFIKFLLIKYVAKKNKPIILSSGMANEKEIEEAINTIYEQGNHDVIIMHCVSAYPTKFEDLNLETISYYKKKFDEKPFQPVFSCNRAR